MDYQRSRKLLSLTIIFFWASEYCHAPYFTPYLQTLGFAATIIGVITGTYGFTQMLVRIPLGMVTDATGGYRTAILMGTILTTLSSFGLMFATNLVPILICRVLAGLAASTWIAFTVLYNAYFQADESVQAMTNVNAFNSAGKFLAFLLGLATASLWGYKVPLVCSFLTGVAAVICACCLKPIPLRRDAFKLGHAVQVMTNPSVLCAAGFGIIVQLFMQGTVFSFTSAVAESLGANAFEIGLATVLFTLVQVAGAKPLKQVLKRWNTVQAITIGCAMLTASCLMAGFAPAVWMIYVSQIVAGIGNLTLNSVLMSMIVRHTVQEKQSTAMGMYQALYGIGMAAGPVAVGRMVTAGGFHLAYGAVAVLLAVSMLVAPLIVGKVEGESLFAKGQKK